MRVIGVGNPLMGDDGVGIAAIEQLSAGPLPDGVEAIDGGTGGLTLLGLMEGAEAVIVIDAVAFGRAPGSVVRFTPDEVLLPDGAGGLSLHQSGLAQVLALGRELGVLPPVVLYGVEPETVERRLDLSPAVLQAVPSLLAQIRAELAESIP